MNQHDGLISSHGSPSELGACVAPKSPRTYTQHSQQHRRDRTPGHHCRLMASSIEAVVVSCAVHHSVVVVSVDVVVVGSSVVDISVDVVGSSVEVVVVSVDVVGSSVDVDVSSVNVIVFSFDFGGALTIVAVDASAESADSSAKLAKESTSCMASLPWIRRVQIESNIWMRCHMASPATMAISGVY